MKYDDAEYCFLNFETDLENEAGGTHTGMYLAWAALRGLLDEGFHEATLAPLRARQITGSSLYFDRCDGKLMDDDFNDEGNAFTASYYGEHFVADYQRVFEKMMPNAGATTDDFCSVPDTWENFDRLAPLLDQRYAQWQQAQAAPAATPPAPVPPASPARAPLAILEDPAEAVEKIRVRAEGGDDAAWFDLGVEYVTGERVPHDMAKAADAFTRGAERGVPECQYNLGVCLQRGDGRAKDAARALHWFSQAANNGHGEGTYMLGLAYRGGLGVPQDLLAANALMLLAQSRGSDAARKEGITAGTLLESTVLLDQIRQPGQLLPTLARRRSATSAVGASRSSGAVRAASASSDRHRDASHADTGRVGGAAVVALLVGAVGFILLLLASSFVKGTALQGLAVLLGAVAAFGAYRCSQGLGKPVVVSAVWAVLAFVPVLGSFVCLALVLQIYREYKSPRSPS